MELKLRLLIVFVKISITVSVFCNKYMLAFLTAGNDEVDFIHQTMDRVGGNRKDTKGNTGPLFVDGSTNSFGNSFEEVSREPKSIIPITISSTENGIHKGSKLKTGSFHSSFDSSDCERFHEVKESNVVRYDRRTESILKLQEVFSSVHSTKSQCLSNFTTKKESRPNRTSDAQCTRSDCGPLTSNTYDNETSYRSLISRMSSENTGYSRARYESSEFFSKNIWNGGKICPGKRSSFACPYQSASAFDKFSFHDDQSFPFFSSASLPSTKRRTELNPDLRVSFPPTESNSRLFESTVKADNALQGSYICAETVRSVLVARGLKIHPKRVEGPHPNAAETTWPPRNDAHELSSSLRRVCVRTESGAKSFNNELKALDESESSTTEMAKQRKGILANRRRNKKKRVSFSDNVALVLSAEDVPPLQPLNYVGRASLPPPMMSGSNPAGLVLRFSSLSSNGSGDSAYSSLSESASLSSDSPESPDFSGGGTGSEVRIVNEDCESGNDDDDDHHILEEDVDSNNSRQIRCGLCCRRWIRAPGIYCHDCRIYMTRLDCSTSDSHC